MDGKGSNARSYLSKINRPAKISKIIQYFYHMLKEKFDHTLDMWISELQKFSFDELCRKPSITSWSMSQVCMHLLKETDFYFGQAKICALTDNDDDKKMSANAEKLFNDSELSDVIIEGPDTNTEFTLPESKKWLIKRFEKLKNDAEIIAGLISKTSFHGKTSHPGFGYFGAHDWFKFAEIHMRHHLRQQKRIALFLKSS